MEPNVAEIEIMYSTITKFDFNPPEQIALVLLEL